MAQTIEGRENVVREEEAIARREDSPQQAFDELDEILNADFNPDAAPKAFNRTRDQPAYRYYQKVLPLLPDWWNEFNTALSVKGGPKYRTIRAFATQKGKTELEKQYILEMVGSKRMVEENGLKNLRLPWLGDWEQRRANSWCSPQNSKKMAALQRAIKEKVVAWDAVRSAAPFLVQELARWIKMAEKVDKAFGGEPFDPDLSPNDPDNKERFRTYFSMHKDLHKMKQKIIDQWMLVHGINPEDPKFQVNMNTLFAQVGTPGGVSDPNSVNPPARKELALLQLAQHLQHHADNFDMPLPEEAFPKHHATQEKPHKGNGKVQ